MSATWTVPGTTIRDDLLAHAKASSPGLLYGDDTRELELETTQAVLLERAKAYVDDWVRMTYIQYADGVWIVAHARDRGVYLKDGQTVEAQRAQIKLNPETVTRPAIVAAAQAIVDDAGVSGTVYAVELRHDKAHFGDYTSDSHSDGGEFVDLGDDIIEFQPTTAFDTVPIEGQDKIVISGSASNDGTFVIDRLNGNALRYTNASGGDESLGGGTVKIEKYDVDGNVADGFPKSYLSRGYRMGSLASPNVGILILPYGTSEATRLAVDGLVSQMKVFGVKAIVERRENP